jgi:DNA repair ATPase RecN
MASRENIRAKINELGAHHNEEAAKLLQLKAQIEETYKNSDVPDEVMQDFNEKLDLLYGLKRKYHRLFQYYKESRMFKHTRMPAGFELSEYNITPLQPNIPDEQTKYNGLTLKGGKKTRRKSKNKKNKRTRRH